MTNAPEFTKGQTITLTEDLTVQHEEGFEYVVPAGSEVTITEVFADDARWQEFGVVNLDVEYDEEVTVANEFDRSGCSDFEVRFQGVANIDHKP